MRPSQKSNRSRGRGNRKNGGGGNSVNRVYDSAGPEGKVRGTPQQIIDKYLSLARDAQTSGDRVAAENFLQHAEHYQRILILATAGQEQNRRDNGGQGGDQSDEDDQQDNAAQGAQQSGNGGNGGGNRPQQQAAEIGGMTTIDAGSEPDQGSLLIETEELGQSQPRNNGEDRPPRRRRRPAAAAPAEAGDQEAPAEG